MMIAIVLLAGFLGSLFLAAILRGWVLSYLWLWFAVPFGLPPIGIAWAIGIGGLVGMLTRDVPVPADDDLTTSEQMAKLGRVYFNLAMVPLVSLLIGWITHGIMVS